LFFCTIKGYAFFTDEPANRIGLPNHNNAEDNGKGAGAMETMLCSVTGIENKENKTESKTRLKKSRASSGRRESRQRDANQLQSARDGNVIKTGSRNRD
jgi:hypothetical protein